MNDDQRQNSANTESNRDPALAAQKAALRRRMAAIRDGLTERERTERSNAICLRFLEAWAETLLQGRGEGKALAAFVPFRSEADVMGIVRWCWERNVKVALPRVDPGATRELTLHVAAGEQDLEPGAYGIREPKPQTPRLEQTGAISLMLVPGLAFDAAGRRLGYGGGYYDRLLERIGAGATVTVAPAFEAQLIDAVPAEPHDATVRFVVTEARIIHVPSN